MPKTVRAKLLLGWMPEVEGLAVLEKCVFDPPLTPEQKRELWLEYHHRVKALPQECEPCSAPR
jgi:hypothetical protein